VWLCGADGIEKAEIGEFVQAPKKEAGSKAASSWWKTEDLGEMFGSSQSPKEASPPFLVREFRAAACVVRGRFKGRGWDSSVTPVSLLAERS
jgi:hypothetical protein